jgi:hypothetical protein
MQILIKEDTKPVFETYLFFGYALWEPVSSLTRNSKLLGEL